MSGRRSRAFRAYQKVKTLRPSRSLFDLSHDTLFSGDMGKLYPICAMEMSPGDTFHIWNEIVTRMQPLNAPILHSINQYTHYFFIPYRILWDLWTEFITGGTEGDKGGNTRGEDVDPSEVSPSLPRWIPLSTAVGSLWDYFGLPTGVSPAGAYPLAFLKYAYNKVWNDYYRDENLQEEVSLDSEVLLKRNWKKDYFTSALEGQQRGVAPALPVNGTISAQIDNAEVHFTLSEKTSNVADTVLSSTLRWSVEFTASDITEFQSIINLYCSSAVLSVRGSTNQDYPLSNIQLVQQTYQSGQGGQSYIAVFTAPNPVSFGSISFTANVVGSYNVQTRTYESDSSEVTGLGASISDLRQAFQIQKWLELANRGGVRYTEFLRAFFGVSPRDDRLQRPEYIGGTKTPLIISEVLQTSATDNEPTPTGYMAGHGISATRSYVGSYTAVEYGICLGLLSVMPSTKYQQGINRQWLRRSKFDFLFPQFTGLSEQAIEGAEIYATDNATENRKVWGFNEIYDELRAMPSKICGKMRTVFNYWHLARIFDSKPSLNSDFIECNPSKRIFAVPSEDGFIFNVGNIIRAVRPLPKYGTPKGV